jgi:hypothetical protein
VLADSAISVLFIGGVISSYFGLVCVDGWITYVWYCMYWSVAGNLTRKYYPLFSCHHTVGALSCAFHVLMEVSILVSWECRQLSDIAFAKTGMTGYCMYVHMRRMTAASCLGWSVALLLWGF